MKNIPLIRALWVLCPLLLLSITGWSANETFNANPQNNYTCTMSISVTPNGVYCGETHGSIDVKITGGSAPYTVEWDNSNSTIWAEATTSNKSYSITDLPKGSYLVKVRDANGCLEMVTDVTLDVNASDLTYTLEPSEPCQNIGSMTIRISGSAPPYWIILDGPTSGGIIATTNDFKIDNLLGGSYTVTVDKDGCGHATQTTIITTTEELTGHASAVDNHNSCDNFGDVQLDLSGGSPGYFISWHGPTTGSTEATGSKLVQNLEQGAYTFVIRDVNGCSITKHVTVSASRSNMSATLTQTPVICDNMGQIGVSISGGDAGYSVSYSGPVSGTLTATNTGNNAGNASILDLPPGHYTITVTDSKGCSDVKSIEVGGEMKDVSCIVTQTPVECDNMGQIGVAISGGNPAFRVDYTGPKSGSIVATTTGERTATASILDLPPGHYVITVTDSRGCSASEAIDVTGSITDMSTIVTQTPVECDNMGQIGVAISGGDPTYRIDYTGPKSGSLIATTTGPKAGNGTILGMPAGTYTIIVTDSRGCSDTEYITVTGSLSDMSSIVTQTPVICNNMGQVGVIIEGGSPTYRIDYTGPKTGSVIATTTGAKSGTGSISDLPIGNYTIVVTDSRGCSDTKTITVDNSVSDLACVLNQTPQICDNMGGITVGISGGYPDYRIDYTGPTTGAIIATTTGNRTGTANITGLSAGTYTIVVSDSKGCSASESITVGGGAPDMVCYVGVQSQICENNAGLDIGVRGGSPVYTVSYSGPVSGSYVSTDGATQFVPLPLGDYTVVVTDVNGCSVTETATVGTGVNDLHCRLVNTHAICLKNGAIEVIISGGKPGFTVKWSTGHAENVGHSDGYSYKFEVPCPGVYNITVIDANGCEVNESTEIFQLENNLAFQVIPNPGIQEGNGSAEIYFQSGQAPYTINLTGPAVQTQITSGPIVLSNLPSGYYSAVVTDGNGCSSQRYFTIPEIGATDVPDGPDVDGMKVNNNQGTALIAGKTSTKNKEGQEKLSSSPFNIGNSSQKDEFVVFQNYPNPFKSSTTISFNLPKDRNVKIIVHDYLGKTISVVEQQFSQGYNEYEFNQTSLAKGVYYYTISTGTNSKTKRMLHID